MCAFTLFSHIANAYIYEIPYYITGTGTTLNINGISAFTVDDCEIELLSYSNLTGSNWDATITWFSPDNTTKATGTLTDQNNHLCKYVGATSETTDLNNYYEGRNYIVNTATAGYVTLTNKFTCMENKHFFEMLVNAESNNDSFINVPFRFGGTTSPGYTTNATILAAANETVYDHCYSGLTVNSFLSETGTASASGSYDRSVYSYYPFNSSSVGTVKYRFDLGSGSKTALYCTESCAGTNFIGTIDLWLFDVEAGTYITLYSSQIDCETGTRISGNLTGTLNLDENKIYMFVYASRYDDDGAVFPCSRTWALYEPFIFNISVMVYTPNLECSDWSECTETFQTRTCIDLDGIVPDKIEYRACSLLVYENATIGFESFYTTNDIIKCEPTWLIYCGYQLTNISVDRPLNWTVIDPSYGGANFLRMTSEYATDGTRSLKMWEIPPKPGEIIDNSTCGNLTSAIIPQLYQNVSNTSFSVAYNVTFPSSYMQIGFDVAKCETPELQHSALLDEGIFFNVTLCNQRCYSGRCDDEPNGRYVFNIIDTVTGTSIFGNAQYLNADLMTDSPLFDISDLGIVPGRNYRVIFGVVNENPHDTTANCIYLDNVHYQVTDTPLTELITDCNSRCIGATRYEATRTDSGSCFVTVREQSPECVDDTTAESIENNEDYCDTENDNILQRYNDKKKKYESITCDYGCFDAHCLEQGETTGETPQDTAEYMEALRNNAIPIVISVLIFITTLIIALKKENAWPVFLFGLAQLIFIISVANVISQWFAVGEIVLAGIIAAYWISKTAGSG